jgi:dienelactone hydrolase
MGETMQARRRKVRPVAEVLLFHHVQGLTEGVREFAERLSAGRHIVHTPDLYEGRTGTTLEEGFAIRTQIGDDALAERVERVVADVPPGIVYAGISMGVMHAQQLAQTRPGARGALLYEACVPVTGEWAFGPWPAGVPVQIHGMDDDEFFAHEGDVDAARELVSTVGTELAELFTYAGSSHLFIDSSLPTFDATATAEVVSRSTKFLDRLE